MPPRSPPRSPPTHFLCIPLAGAQLARSLSSFRADVTSVTSFGLPEDAVRPLGTLHLTLGVMALKGDSVDRAVELLRGLRLGDMLREARAACSAPRPLGDGEDGVVLPVSGCRGGPGPSKLAVSIRGLRSMQPAAKAAVLYAAPKDAEGILYDFCHRLRKPFRDSGLMVDEGRPLLLHATLFNTIYARSKGRSRGKERLTVDARQVLSRYEDFVWAEDLPLTHVAICRMGAKRIEGTDDAAYEVEAEIDL
ncbi:Uncharacterized protein ESCO_001018 [Escovopsis weberi]|uniref:A-kinase anchor protein 7-like phosphoesterase domain-containing protein n=1 Tax=Escovopsis weberi TaxID=150374 RepID=A0A0M8MXG0_ESCWE|nr:Uncharacterized protein ESCO_001018 [Escovopsis weberi]